VNELEEFQELQEFHGVESFSVKFGEFADTKTDTAIWGEKSLPNALANAIRSCGIPNAGF
jgi:hypothetical protein